MNYLLRIVIFTVSQMSNFKAEKIIFLIIFFQVSQKWNTRQTKFNQCNFV